MKPRDKFLLKSPFRKLTAKLHRTYDINTCLERGDNTYFVDQCWRLLFHPREPMDKWIDYNHIESISVINGGDNYQSGMGVRGDVVKITLSNENSEDWYILLGEHKGTVSIMVGEGKLPERNEAKSAGR